MPHVGNLYDFLASVDLQQYHHDFVNKLGVTTVEHVTYVQSDDVLRLGMTAPEWRRLQASMKKARKGKLTSVKDKITGGKQKPTIVRVNTKDGTPTGGHIIPSTAIQITDRELGRGEFGKVMQGIWTNDNGQKIQVAVKCLSPERFDEKGAQDFIKEAAIMHSLNHQHLVKLFGLVLDMDSSLVLVTEFAPLRSLCENLKQPALRISFPVNLLLDFTQQIADAMKYLHYSNIIHRDLATRNILLFVDDEGSKLVKISDFGLSRRLMFEENYRSEMRPNLKLPLAWMPVEALTKLTFTRASDVWSFGVTMWEMFSYGCQPWATKSGEEILRAIDRPNLQRLGKPEACPSQVYELILKCWRHEPDSRPTFTEICEEIPKMKPIQVRAVTNYQGSREEELSYRAEDVITVLEANDETGVWRGMTSDGHIGLFHRSNTTLVGGSGGGKLKRWKSGSKGTNKAEHRKRVDSPKTPKRSPSKLTTLDISTPSEYKHVFHVGYDGRIQGDPTFGGDYRSLPSGSEPSKSDQYSSDSNSSRSASSTPHRSPNTTPSKSPTFPSVSVAPRNNHMLTNDPPVTTSSQPELRAGIPITGQPRVRLAEDEKWDSELSLTSDQSVEGAAVSGASASAKTPDDELSSLDFGSLLDDVMTAWDATRTSVGIDHPQATGISDEDANGNASGRSSPTSSIDEELHGASMSTSSQSQGIIMVGEQGARLSSSPEEGSLDSLPPLHNAITKDMPSNPVKTYRRTHSSSQSSATSGTSSQSAQKDSAYDSRDGDVEGMSYTRLSSGVSDSGEIEFIEDMDAYNEAPSPGEHRLNGQTGAAAAATVNGNGHISHESTVDEVLDADDYTDLAAPEHDIRYKDSEFESMSAGSSYSSRVNSQISKASTDSDDERPLRIVTNRQESMSSDHSERLGGGSPTTKPKSPSARSPRKPKCPPPARPKGPPPTKPRASPPPVPPAPWKKQKSPRASNDQYASHSSRRSGSEDEEVYSVSALRQKFDLARRNGAGNDHTERRGSGDSYTRTGRSGSYKEMVNIQASVGRSNSVGSYDSGKEEADVKLSDRTIESLERVLPRRTRRSVGESKHKRRTSSEEGTESDRSSMASSRASEGDSSSDEGATKVTTSYPSATCPLPDLPEDQTNNFSSATHHPHPHPHDNASPSLQRQAQITPQSPQESPRSRFVRQGNTTPPFAPPEVGLLQQRSQSFDAGVITRSEPFPERNPFPAKRHSIDILDTEGSHLVTSPEQIRELLNIKKDDTDMPSRTPPAVPKTLSKTQSIGLGVDGQHKRSRALGYEFMKPQGDLKINLSPPHEQQDSDSGLDSPQQQDNRYGGIYKLLHGDRLQNTGDHDMQYVRMGSPTAVRRDIDIGEGKFTRSRSAHIIKWIRKPDEETSSKHRWEDVTTVARSKFKDDGKRLKGRRSLASRKSRSVDDLLACGGEYAELREAESLRDVLARTYVPPSSGDSADQHIYLAPRSWKTNQSLEDTLDESNLTPLAVSNVVHPSAPAPLQQTSPPSETLSPPSLKGHFVKDRNDPGYIDMTSPSPEVYSSPPFFKTATIPEEEPLSQNNGSEAYISLADSVVKSSPGKESNILPSQSEELHCSQSSLPSSGYSNYDVPPRLKSRLSPSKEQHVLPNQPRSTELSPNRTERASSLTKTLNQAVPLPKRNRQVRFNSNVVSHDDDTEESSVPDEVSQSTKARELKEQLPREIPVKDCFEALRDSNWDIEAAKHQLLIHHLAKTQAVEENACESALRQCNWNLREAIDVLNDAPELSVSL